MKWYSEFIAELFKEHYPNIKGVEANTIEGIISTAHKKTLAHSGDTVDDTTALYMVMYLHLFATSTDIPTQGLESPDQKQPKEYIQRKTLADPHDLIPISLLLAQEYANDNDLDTKRLRESLKEDNKKLNELIEELKKNIGIQQVSQPRIPRRAIKRLPYKYTMLERAGLFSLFIAKRIALLLIFPVFVGALVGFFMASMTAYQMFTAHAAVHLLGLITLSPITAGVILVLLAVAALVIAGLSIYAERQLAKSMNSEEMSQIFSTQEPHSEQPQIKNLYNSDVLAAQSMDNDSATTTDSLNNTSPNQFDPTFSPTQDLTGDQRVDSSIPTIHPATPTRV